MSNNAAFDLVRIAKAKKACDLCPNTIRQYGKQGLPLYKRGKAVFFSLSELGEFIKRQSTIDQRRAA